MTGIMENGLQRSVKTAIASRFVVRFATFLTYCSLLAIFLGSSGVFCADLETIKENEVLADNSEVSSSSTDDEDSSDDLDDLPIVEFNYQKLDLSGKNWFLQEQLKQVRVELKSKVAEILKLTESNTELSDDIRDRDEFNADLNKENENLSNELRAQRGEAQAALKSKCKELSEEVTRLTKIIAVLTKTNKAFDDWTDKLQAELADSKGRVDELTLANDDLKANLEKQTEKSNSSSWLTLPVVRSSLVNALTKIDGFSSFEPAEVKSNDAEGLQELVGNVSSQVSNLHEAAVAKASMKSTKSSSPKLILFLVLMLIVASATIIFFVLGNHDLSHMLPWNHGALHDDPASMPTGLEEVVVEAPDSDAQTSCCC
eukprot:526408_1